MTIETTDSQAREQLKTPMDRIALLSPSSANGWQPIDDRVMEGVSSSQLRHDPAGFAVFEGVVSPDRGGGFASRFKGAHIRDSLVGWMVDMLSKQRAVVGGCIVPWRAVFRSVSNYR